MKRWYTAAELAALKLPGLPTSERGIGLLAARDGWAEDCFPDGKPKARRRAGRGGGMEYETAVLPSGAREQLDAEIAREEAAGIEARRKREKSDRWAAFDALPEKHKATAHHRFNVLTYDDGLRIKRGKSRRVAVAIAAKKFGVSSRSIYNWMRLVDGLDPSAWLPALAPRYKGGGKAAAVDAEAWEVLKADYLRPERPGFAACYRRLRKIARAQGWEIPGEQALRRKMERDVPWDVLKLKRHGAEALKQSLPAQRRDRSHFHALEAINADCHIFDNAVNFGEINGRPIIARPALHSFQDLYSSKVLSWRIDQTVNGDNVRLALGDLLERFGVPSQCYFDNGHEFANKILTGGAKHRFRFKIRKEDPFGILPSLGCAVKFVLVESGRSKPIERSYRDHAEDIAKEPRFAGSWLGNNPLNKPENYGDRAIPIEDYKAIVDELIADHNARPGRRTATAARRSFDETFAESYAVSEIRRISAPERRLFLLAAETIKARSNTGEIHLHDNRYYDMFLGALAGQRLVIRFDPDNLKDGVHCYDLEGRYLGFAPCIDDVGFDDTSAAREAGRFQRQAKKSAKEAGEALLKLGVEDVAAYMEEAGRRFADDSLPAPGIPKPNFLRPTIETIGRVERPQAFGAAHVEPGDGEADNVVPIKKTQEGSPFDDDASFVSWVAANSDEASPGQIKHAKALLKASPSLQLLEGVEALRDLKTG